MKRLALAILILPLLSACQRDDATQLTQEMREPIGPAAPSQLPGTAGTPTAIGEAGGASAEAGQPSGSQATAEAPSDMEQQNSAGGMPAPGAASEEQSGQSQSGSMAMPPAPSDSAGGMESGAAGMGEEYTVAAGDTLSGIARQHGLNYRELAEWNNLDNPAMIRPGQTLRMSPPD